VQHLLHWPLYHLVHQVLPSLQDITDQLIVKLQERRQDNQDGYDIRFTPKHYRQQKTKKKPD